MTIVIAGAPVSFGVFELTPDDDSLVLPTADELCEALRETGYAGVDSGPIGFLGRGEELRARLRSSGLPLAGGWVDLPFSDDAAFEAALPTLTAALEFFVEGIDPEAPLAPKPTLADSGDAVRKANPGGGGGHQLDEAGWQRFARNVQRAVDQVRAAGLEPTFHHHACTYVETPAEVDELLARTDVGLCFDTGHLLIGGGDVLEGWRRWRDRINHLHVKDVRVDRLREIVARKGGMLDVWSGGVFVPFGAGDLEIDTFMDEVLASGYDGWLVVEQDLMPKPGDDPAQVKADHARNRDVLSRWL
ncbi:MAG TPA: sugar phosphate isomerase/epimerase [Propionibacteriaceae bacterium]|nr:sugar phosphate isomerase/epimerase [Propionibacteriaceae bacterium]HPZ50589.1 sugar phosphate isomerase/epimerase [Propionibacteriaceae bacterium]